MANSLTSLFFMRPFGAQNLAQKLTSVATALNTTSNELKEKKKALNLPELTQRVEQWVALKYKSGENLFQPQPSSQEISPSETEELQEVPLDESAPQFEKIFKQNDANSWPSLLPKIENLTETKRKQLLEIIELEMRKQDKMNLVELVGDPDFSDLIKKVFPIFCKPLGEVYGAAGFPEWMKSFFKWSKVNYTVGESAHTMTEEERRETLNKALLELEQSQYQLFHNLVKADKRGIALKVVTWFFDKFKLGDGLELDLDPLIKSLGENERSKVQQDVEKLVAFNRFRDHMFTIDFKKAKELKSPPHPHITKYLVVQFESALKRVLSNISNVATS
jgi:hypothetical protein